MWTRWRSWSRHGLPVSTRRATWTFRPLRFVLVPGPALRGPLIATALLLASLRTEQPTSIGTAYVAVVSRLTSPAACRTTNRGRRASSRSGTTVRSALITTLRIPPRDPEGEPSPVRDRLAAVGIEGLRLMDLRDPSHVVDLRSARMAVVDPGWSVRPVDGVRPDAPDGPGDRDHHDAVGALARPRLGLKRDPLSARSTAGLADGTGFVMGGRGQLLIDGSVVHRRWSVVYLDGRPDGQIIPRLDPSLSMGTGAAGMGLQLRDLSLDEACPGLPNGTVVGEAADGTQTTWYRDELAPDDVVAARFTRDGTAMWLLLDRREGGRQFALARVEAGGTATEVLSAGLPSSDSDMYWQVLDVAPDDSLVALGGMGDLVLAEPVTGRVRAVEGNLLGFVRASRSRRMGRRPVWRGRSGRARSRPGSPPGSTLPPLSEFIVDHVPSDGTVLWRWEQAADRRSGRLGGARSCPEPIVLAWELRGEARLQRALGRGGHDGPARGGRWPQRVRRLELPRR